METSCRSRCCRILLRSRSSADARDIPHRVSSAGARLCEQSQAYRCSEGVRTSTSVPYAQHERLRRRSGADQAEKAVRDLTLAR